MTLFLSPMIVPINKESVVSYVVSKIFARREATRTLKQRPWRDLLILVFSLSSYVYIIFELYFYVIKFVVLIDNLSTYKPLIFRMVFLCK